PDQPAGAGRDQGPGEDRVPGLLDGAQRGMDRALAAADPPRAPGLRGAPAEVRRVRAQRFLPVLPGAPQAPPPGAGCTYRGPTLLPAGAHPQPASLTGIQPHKGGAYNSGC